MATVAGRGRVSDRKDDLIDRIVQNGDISYSDIPGGLLEGDFDSSGSSEQVILDENIVDDIKHAVVRQNGEAELFAAVPLVAEMFGEGEVYMDHSVLEDLYSESYGEVSTLDEEVLEDVEDFFREYTTDLAVDEWADQLDETGDELYRWIAEYQDAALLTYDGDFEYTDVAMTPGISLACRRD